MIKGFEEVRIWSEAGVRLLEEEIPNETKADRLKEIIGFASHLVARWDSVWTLAERRLEVIEEVERIRQSRDN